MATKIYRGITLEIKLETFLVSMKTVWEKTALFLHFQRVYVGTSRQLKRIESVSRSPIFNNFFETINGASTIRAFGQQQRLIKDNYHRVDENHVAYFPGTSANRCVISILVFKRCARLQLAKNFLQL